MEDQRERRREEIRAVSRAFFLARTAYQENLTDARGAVNVIHSTVGDPDCALLTDAQALAGLERMILDPADREFLETLRAKLTGA